MQFYRKLDSTYPAIKTYKIGLTDSGEPITLVTYNPANPDRTLETEFSKTQILTNYSSTTVFILVNQMELTRP